MAVAAAVLCVSGIVATNASGFIAPEGYWSIFGNNESAARQFSEAFGLNFVPMAATDFVPWLRVSITAAWLGYVLMLWLAFVRPNAFGSWITVTAVILALLVGALTPPWLSSDIYSYIAYGRMHALHGLNPYLDLPSRLTDYPQESITTLLHWNATSRYGPLWTILSGWVLLPLATASVFSQVLAIKLMATVAHVSLAFGAARLSALVKPQWKHVSFVLIAFSPLFVAEGPGSGHNDTWMLALAVWGAVFWQQGQLKTACMLLGLAGAIKFITFVLLFWLIGQRWFQNAHRWLSTLRLVAIGFGPFALMQLYLTPDITNLFSALKFSYSGDPLPSSIPDAAMVVPFALVAAVLSIAVVTNHLMHWTSAWTLLTLLAVAMIGPAWPWYLMWSGIFLFAGYSRFLPFAVFPYVVSGFFLMVGYSIVP